MAKRQIQAGSTSVILGDVFLQDSSKSTGDGLAGLVFNSAGFTCYYHRNTANASVAVSLVTMTLGTFTSGGFKEVDATNMKGICSFCPPDAALAAGAQSVTFYFQGATNLAPMPIEVELTAFNIQSSTVTLGATGLDNIAVTDPGAPANHTTLAKMLVAMWRAMWKKDTLTSSQWKRYADDGTTVNATSAVTDDGTTQTKGAFS